MSTQERIDTQARSGRSDPPATRASVATRSGADRLPRPPGRRRPGLAAIAVLLIVLGAAVAGLLATRIDDRVPVLVARREISVGARIGSSDLAVAELASSGVAVIPAGQASQVVGKYATTTIAPGRLIDPDMLGTSGLLTAGSAAVGLSLPAGRYPASGLLSGDVVQVVKTTDGLGKVIAPRAVVGTVQTPGQSIFGTSTSNNTVVTLIVTTKESPAIAAAAAAQSVSLVLLSRGEPTGGG